MFNCLLWISSTISQPLWVRVGRKGSEEGKNVPGITTLKSALRRRMYLVRLARRWLGLRMCSHKTTYTTVASQPAALECSDCRIIMSSFQSKQLQWQPSRIQNLLFWRQLIKSVTKKIINILQNRISTQNFLSLLHTLRVYYCMGEDVDGGCRGGAQL